MEYMLSDSDRLKLSLTAQDMRMLGLNFDQKDSTTLRQARRTLLRLVIEARTAYGLSSDIGGTTELQVCLGRAGGCTVYCDMGKHGNRPVVYEPIVYDFENAEAMIEASIRLFRQYGHQRFQSSLYAQKSGYRLIVRPSDGPCECTASLLAEYGKRLPNGTMAAALLEEHAVPVLSEKAVDTISYFFDR